MKRMKSLLGAMGALVGAGALMGCGGLSPGDYEVYRVAFATMEQSSGCFNDNMGKPAPDDAFDSSTLRSTATWILYAGPEDKLYIDTGAVTLEGEETDEGYEFGGTLVDVDVENDLDGTGYKLKTTITTTVSVITDGDAISGEAVTEKVYDCAGSTCNPVAPPCTRTTPFVGTRIDDVQLNYDIANPPPPSP